MIQEMERNDDKTNFEYPQFRANRHYKGNMQAINRQKHTNGASQEYGPLKSNATEVPLPELADFNDNYEDRKT